MEKRQDEIKCNTGGWSTSPYILGTQALSTIGYAGLSTNLILYLTGVLHEGNAAAANNVSNWIGTSYITSLIGGFLADAYWGRYWTTAAFLAINLLGMILVTLTVTVPALKPQASHDATAAQVGALYVGLYIVALGYGGYQPCLTSLGADQFDKSDEKEQSNSATFFNWYYLSITIGATVSGLLLVYVEDNLGWALGFGISTAATASGLAMFLAGTRRYRHHKTAGNPFTRVAQVLVAAVHNKSSSSLLYEVDCKGSAIQGSRKIEHTSNFRFLDRAAAVATHNFKAVDPWRLCTVTQVEEVKCMMRMLPIWATGIIFSAIYTQVSTLFIEQGAAMDTHVQGFKIPPASLYTICTLSVLLLTPAYEWMVVPLGRRLTGNKRGLTSLQRMGVGLLVATLAVICAAVVELVRLRRYSENKLARMSALWQVPQYFLVGASEVFTYIGQLDFFYEQSPDGIRGLGVALASTSYALGNFASSLIVTLVMQITSKPGWIPPDNLNKGHLDYFFWLLTALSLCNLVLYCACANWYKYIQFHKDDVNDNVV